MSAIAAATGRSSRRRRNLLVIIAVLILAGVVGVGFGLWYVLIGPPGPAIAAPVIPTGASVPAPASMNGTWQVNDQLGSFSNFSSSWLGYRVQEQFVGVGGHTAVGRTPKVTGSLTLSGSTVTAVSITGDLTALVSDSPQRDGELGGVAIQSDTFPNATFVLTRPMDLGSLPSDGSTVSATATGNLTLHGVTRSVQVDLQAQRQGGIIAVSGSLPIVFGDYNFTAPRILGFVTVNDHGTMELHLLFTHA
jgi:polyisoprenoid-binding protein YceI